MIHTQNEGIYHALLAQLDKLERHNRQCSYKTRQRYYEAMQRFCRFLADVYHLQKLANISGKHLVAYVRHLQENGKAASTIKTELAAIRFWHGGRVRSVPVTAAAAKQALRDRKAAVRRGHKLFVPDDVATDAYIHAFQAFLREHRPDQGTNPRPLTHHGMRHSYAARQYREALDGGATEDRAKLEVSKLLGHGRADVTDVYLASRKA